MTALNALIFSIRTRRGRSKVQWKRKEKREEKKRNERKIYSTKIIRQKTREGEFANTSSSWGATSRQFFDWMDNECELVGVSGAVVAIDLTFELNLHDMGFSVPQREEFALFCVFSSKYEVIHHIHHIGIPLHEAAVSNSRAEPESVHSIDMLGSRRLIDDEINLNGLV